MFIFVGLLGVLTLALAENCSVVTDFETTCKIGGLILTKPEDKITVSEDNCDEIYKKQQFATAPTVTYPKAEKGQTYTVVAIDPDAPNHPKGFYYLHWIAANIAGEDLVKGDLSKATSLTDYIGPGPPVNTGLHRYMFLVFRQSDPNLRLKNKLTQQERRRFNLANWLSNVQANEGALCGPLAGIQFRSQFA